MRGDLRGRSLPESEVSQEVGIRVPLESDTGGSVFCVSSLFLMHVCIPASVITFADALSVKSVKFLCGDTFFFPLIKSAKNVQHELV